MEATASILTSTLLAAFVSAGVSALFSVVIKNKEYRNEYYKKVIEKRMKVVESVEAMLSLFSLITLVSDSDRPIFNFFIEKPRNKGGVPIDEEDSFSRVIHGIAQQSIWLSPKSQGLTHQFNEIILRLRHNAKDIELGPKLAEYYLRNHELVAKSKQALEQSLADDMANLYDVKAFFRARKKEAQKG